MPAAVLLLSLAAAPAARAGWLGVQLQAVPPPLAAHFHLDHGGLMVENVTRDGPADRVGLDRWDIITAMDGQPVTSDLAAFTRTIQARPAGDAVNLTFIHAGQSTTAGVTLDERPASLEDPHWKYDVQPRDILQERIRVRGHALTKDDKGNWMLKNVLDLPQLAPLPGDLKDLFHGITMEVFVTRDEDGNQVTIEREESDGRKIEVTIKGDDPIVVRRTEIVAGQTSTTEQTYDDLDALRQADPEVYDLLDGTQERGVIQIGPTGSGVDPRVLKLDTLIQIEDELDHSSEALAEYFSTLARTLDSSWLNLGTGKSISALPRPFTAWHEARISFRTQPNGQIEVTRRTGESELTDVYRDEDDLKTRDPWMYERYRSLRESAGAANPP